MIEDVIFDGIRISDYFDVIDVTRPNPATTSATTEVSGMDGLVLTGSTLGTATITVAILLRETTVSARRARMREAWRLLHTRDERPLEFSEDEGLYYMAKLDGDMPFKEYVRSGRLDVNFTAFDPAMYGRRMSVTVPSGGSVSFVVDGNYPTYPRITGSVNGANQTGNLWGIRLDDGDNMRVPMGGTSAKQIDIDCATRACKVAGLITLPTMQSDWLRLDVGTHTLRNDVGSGACVVTWDERWL